MKKLLAVMVIIGLVASSSAIASAAAGDLQGAAFNDIAGHPGEAALTALGALGVFSGTQGLGGPVDPNNPITREAYCKVVVEAIGKGAQAQALMGMKPPGFSDADNIAPWFWGYVNVAVSNGIIKGYQDGTFRPKNNVTYAEALVMLIRCVANHEDQLNTALGWPASVIFYAVPQGFSGDVSISDPNGACSRSDMARFLIATMQVDPLDTTGAPVAGGAILAEGGRLRTGKFLSATGGDLYLDTYPGALALGDAVYMVGGSSYEECTGIQVTCIAKADGKIVFIERAAGNTAVGLFKALGSDGSGTYIELKSGQKVYYTGHVTTNLNNQDGLNETALRLDDELTINLDSSDKAVFVAAKRWDLVNKRFTLFLPTLPPTTTYIFTPGFEDCLKAVTPSSGSTNTKIQFAAGSPYYYRNGSLTGATMASAMLEVPATATIKINGLTASRDDLQADDVIRARTLGAQGYLNAGSIIEIEATRTIVDGTVVTCRSVSDASGTRHYVTINASGTTREYERLLHYIPMEPSEGTRHKFALDRQGRLFHEILLGVSTYDVYVKSTMVSGGRYYITVDNRGTEQQYECTVDRTGLEQEFARIFVNNTTGLCYDVWPVETALIETNFKVMAASATSLTIQRIAPPNDTLFTTNDATVAYKMVGSDWVFCGTGGLAVNDVVSIFAPGGYGIVFVFFGP